MNSSQYVSNSTLAPSEYQKEYTGGQQVKFDIPSFYGFVDMRQSYLRADVELVSTVKCGLSRYLGAQALVHNVRVYDYTGSTILENVENYGHITRQTLHYSSNETMTNNRALLEAVESYPSNVLDHNDALFFNQLNGTSSTNLVATGSVNENKVQIAMKLHTGVFGSDKVFPLIVFNGLRVEIDLAQGKEAIMNLATTKYKNAENIAIGTGITTVDLSVAIEDCIFCVGQEAELKIGATTTQLGVITAITKKSAGQTTVSYTNAQIFVAEKKGDVEMALSSTWLALQTYDFKLSNVEFVFKKVQPPAWYSQDYIKDAMGEKGVNLDIKTFDLIRRNIPDSSLISELAIPSFNARAYSIISMFVSNSAKSGSTDSFDTLTNHLKNYNYYLNGVRTPNRVVDVVQRISSATNKVEEQIYLFELMKALKSCGLVIKNMDTLHQFILGRALGRYGGVYNLKDNDLTLRTEYSQASVSNVMALNYICSLRRIRVSNKGVEIVP